MHVTCWRICTSWWETTFFWLRNQIYRALS